MPKHTFLVNGKRVHVECANDVRLLWVLRDHLKRPWAEVRLRTRRLSGVHEPHQRQVVQPLLCTSRTDQEKRPHRHHRGAGRHHRQAAAPHAGGLDRVRRRPMRLLPAGPDHDRRSARGERARQRARSSPMPISARSATSVAAEPIPGSARRSWPEPRGWASPCATSPNPPRPDITSPSTGRWLAKHGSQQGGNAAVTGHPAVAGLSRGLERSSLAWC